MKSILCYVRSLVSNSLLNPVNWLVWAGLVLLAWLALHLAGWRADIAILSGTVDPARGDVHWTLLRGTLYAIAYFAALIVSPILVLASGIYSLAARLIHPTRK